MEMHATVVHPVYTVLVQWRLRSVKNVH
jgi:hypothetical protein